MTDLQEYLEYNLSVSALTDVGPGPDINVVMKQENEDSTEKPILDSSEGTYSLHSTL